MDHFDLLRARNCQSPGGKMMVIFVDDDALVRGSLMRVAKRMGLLAHAPPDFDELLELVEQNLSAVIVFDGNCAKIYALDGWDLVSVLRARGWTGEGVALTGKRDENLTAFLSAGLPAERVFEKPASQEFWKLLAELAE